MFVFKISRETLVLGLLLSIVSSVEARRNISFKEADFCQDKSLIYERQTRYHGNLRSYQNRLTHTLKTNKQNLNKESSVSGQTKRNVENDMNPLSDLEREHILQSDPQEIRLYFLRNDKEIVNGPQDFLRFNKNNADIFNCLPAVSGYTILVHGFSPYEEEPKYGYDVFDEQELLPIAYEYHKRNRLVFVVDWTTYTTRPNAEYQQAADLVEDVGWKARKMLYRIRFQERKKMHCVGYHLGAHVCAWIGYGTVGGSPDIERIDGIGPAGYLFEEGETLYSKRLTFNDAEFVAFHLTDSPMLQVRAAEGHANFYYQYFPFKYANHGHVRPPFYGKCYYEECCNYGTTAYYIGCERCRHVELVSAFYKTLRTIYPATDILDSYDPQFQVLQTSPTDTECVFGASASSRHRGNYQWAPEYWFNPPLNNKCWV